MRKSVLLLFASLLLLSCSADKQKPSWGDLGDGSYANPILNSDYSDPDVVRVGDKYYMVASDFHFLGMQVLESVDMVNWTVISQIYDRFDFPGWDSNEKYAGGSWAPSISYHDGKFWVYFCTPDEGLFLSTATDPRGPWSELHCVKQVPRWEDPAPLWDDDGQAYLGHSLKGAGPIIIHKLSPDGKTLLDDGVVVYRGPVAEGTKWCKRNGYYYLSIPEGGVSTGWQTILRSRDVYGPYERQIVLEQGSTKINGPHQGALVDTPDGQWWFYHFQRVTPYGRVVHLQPAWWTEDDWIKIGIDYDGNGIGEPVQSYSMPKLAARSKRILPASSDNFSPLARRAYVGQKKRQLGLQWQWCHNAVEGSYSLREKPGYLSLHALKADKLRNCRGMISQKTQGDCGYAQTVLELSDSTSSIRAGLCCISKPFYAIGLSQEGVYIENDEPGKEATVQIVEAGRFSKVHLRVDVDSKNNLHFFSYSIDGKEWKRAGDDFTMFDGHWKGTRLGLFSYNTETDGGTAHFRFFKYEFR